MLRIATWRSSVASIIRWSEFERGERLLAAGHEECELADRLQRTARQHDDRDDRAHRHLAVLKAIEAADQQADADQLLRHAGEVDRDRGQPAHPFLGRCRHRRIAPPAAEHLAFGPRGLERLGAGDRFDQHRMLQARIRLRVERGAAHRLLQADAGDQHQRDADDRHQHQPAGEDRDQDQEQDQEADVDRQHDRGRGEEVAHHLIFGDALGEARRCCPGARPSAGSSLSRTASATSLASSLRPISSTSCDRAMRRTKSKTSARHTPSASTHRVGIALLGMTRSYTFIVNSGIAQRQQVDDQRGQQDRPEFAADLPHFRPEPVRALGLVPRPLAFAFAGRIGFDHHRTAGEGRLDLGELDPHRLGDAGRINQPVAVVHFEQDRGAVVRQARGSPGSLLRRPALQSRDERLAAHSDLVERRLDLVERQRARVGKRQPRAQQDRGRRPVRLAREEGQAIEDRVDLTRRPASSQCMKLNTRPLTLTGRPEFRPGCHRAGAAMAGAGGPIAGCGQLFSCRSAGGIGLTLNRARSSPTPRPASARRGTRSAGWSPPARDIAHRAWPGARSRSAPGHCSACSAHPARRAASGGRR